MDCSVGILITELLYTNLFLAPKAPLNCTYKLEENPTGLRIRVELAPYSLQTRTKIIIKVAGRSQATFVFGSVNVPNPISTARAGKLRIHLYWVHITQISSFHKATTGH